MPKRSSNLPADPNQLAKAIVDAATTEEPTAQVPNVEVTPPEKNPAAVALGKLGGKAGGPARAKALSKKRRSEIAKQAARARWRKGSP